MRHSSPSIRRRGTAELGNLGGGEGSGPGLGTHRGGPRAPPTPGPPRGHDCVCAGWGHSAQGSSGEGTRGAGWQAWGRGCRRELQHGQPLEAAGGRPRPPHCARAGGGAGWLMLRATGACGFQAGTRSVGRADHTQGSRSRGRGRWAHGGRPGPPAERPGGRSCHSPRWGLGGAGPCLRLAGGPGWVGGGRRVADPRAAGYTRAPRALGRGTGVCSGHLCCQAEGRGPLHGQVASVNSPAHPMGPREQAAAPPG